MIGSAHCETWHTNLRLYLEFTQTGGYFASTSGQCSIENEWLCSLILREFGLPVATCKPVQFEDIKACVVERFDRAWWDSPGSDRRLLPQEDLCQATGTPPDAKYEADGGPGMERILDVLEGSMAREQDRRTLF